MCVLGFVLFDYERTKDKWKNGVRIRKGWRRNEEHEEGEEQSNWSFFFQLWQLFMEVFWERKLKNIWKENWSFYLQLWEICVARVCFLLMLMAIHGSIDFYKKKKILGLCLKMINIEWESDNRWWMMMTMNDPMILP